MHYDFVLILLQHYAIKRHYNVLSMVLYFGLFIRHFTKFPARVKLIK